MGILESLPIGCRDPSLFVPFWLGGICDNGGNDHTCSVSGVPRWVQSGDRDGILSDDAAFINVVPNGDRLNITGAISLFFFGNFSRQDSTWYLIRTLDSSMYAYGTATTMRFFASPTVSLISQNFVGSKSIAITVAGTATKPEFYLDGSGVGTGNNDVSVSIPSTSWRVCGNGAFGSTNQIAGAIVYDRELTPTEIANLHTWSQSRFTPRKQRPGAGLQYPGRPPLLTGDPVFLDNIQTARVTLANETSGKLSNTDFVINSGTWALAEDATGKYLSCVANGQLEYGLIGASGYTTNLFTATGATLTKNATNFQIDATAGDIVRAVELVA